MALCFAIPLGSSSKTSCPDYNLIINRRRQCSSMGKQVPKLMTAVPGTVLMVEIRSGYALIGLLGFSLYYWSL